MRRLVPTSRRPGERVLVGALACLAVLALAGCNIDKSQWRDISLSDGDSDVGSASTSTSGRGSRATVIQRQTIDTAGDLGVVTGGAAGGRRPSSSSIAVRTDPGTCWVLVVDGNSHRGCGDATISDTRGTSAGRVTKLSGSSSVELSVVRDGQIVASGIVQSSGHYVTVTH